MGRLRIRSAAGRAAGRRVVGAALALWALALHAPRRLSACVRAAPPLRTGRNSNQPPMDLLRMAEPRRAAPSFAPRIDGGRFLIVEARYYESIGAHLLAGAARVLEAAGATYDLVSVDGALEIPAGMAIALDAAIAEARPYDGAVALGCVIRGATFHFEIVAGEPARALMDMSVQRKLALGNAILTTDTIEQAEERADPERGDKGGDAARDAPRETAPAS